MRHPPDGPPIWTALNPSLAGLPSSAVMPPATPYTISRSVEPRGISISPVFTTCPVTAKVLVPGEKEVPIFRKESMPDDTIRGTVERVSTLLIIVGFPQRPLLEGKGGLGRGMPLLPSIEAISAVSSPHTKAPAPSITCRLKVWSVPRTRFPRAPSL